MNNSTSEDQSSIYYGVFKGHVPGVYDSIKLLKLVTSGYSGSAIYKEFDDYDDACVFAASGKVKSFKRCRLSIEQKEKDVKGEKKIKRECSDKSISEKIEKEEREINQLAEEIAAWKVHKEKFKAATFSTALNAKSFLENRGDIPSKSTICKELAKSMQNLSLDLSELIDTTKTLRD